MLNLQVLDGGKGAPPLQRTMPLRQHPLTMPADLWTDIELRHSVVAHHYPERNDFFLALIRAGVNAYDAEVAELRRQAEARNVVVDPDGPATSEEALLDHEEVGRRLGLFGEDGGEG